ncbi:MAG TPA: sigma-54 dependent transcriptional regulator [Acidobacteriota bacterium]|nr:sigma-54 dependent transcriptional regulator [Acidobacteriota bacterium]
MDLKVLILDKDLSLYNTVKNLHFIQDGSVYFSDTRRDLYTFVRNNDINVIITEFKDKSLDGISFVQDIKAFDSLLDVILLGKPLDSEKVLNLIHKGATDYLEMPLKEQDLEKTLKKIKDKRRLRKKTLKLETELEKEFSFQGMVGKSPYMLEIFNVIEKIASYFKCVLITGEAGTGRKMAAQALCSLSQAPNKNFVIFDCVAVPGSLFEQELFGYKKGAFQGAEKTHKGLFEKADKGVIYLDEIGEMPLSFQPKLAQVLEEQKIKPLGAKEKREVDVRVIASSTRNLKEQVKKEKFSQELYNQLNKVEIHIPPLRMRAEDIPLLVRHFLKMFNQKYNKDIKGVSQKVQKFFHSYEWTGNVRELRDVIEIAVEVSDKDFIDMEGLPQYFQESLTRPKKIPFIRREELSTMDALEKEYIIYLLKITDSNMTETAKTMGISRSTLYNKIEKYGIPH